MRTVVAAGERLLRERQEEEKLSKSRTLMENQLFAHLFEGCFNGEWVSRELGLLGLELCGNDFQVAVIRPENLMRYSRSADYEEIDLLLFSIRNVCAELLGEGGEGDSLPQCFFAVYNRQANLIFCLPQPGAAVELLPLLERTRQALAQVLKIPFSIGLGGGFRDMTASPHHTVKRWRRFRFGRWPANRGFLSAARFYRSRARISSC
ncbi:hypothetical protein HMSSN036_02990 [Paenibacillus macerans]|nr:hypothetical protein HMSSN036_02990 [Paenibacillus macerans]